MYRMKESAMDELTLVQPDDWHVHLRDEDALAMTVPAAAQSFGRSIVPYNEARSSSQLLPADH
jgi:dihydroorotase